MNDLALARTAIRERRKQSEQAILEELLGSIHFNESARIAITQQAQTWVKTLRNDVSPGLMESFLSEYGLSTDEGVALMCLAEAYLRTPDNITLDALIRDKIGGGDWSRHRGGADSPFVNVSTWALMLTGRIFRSQDGKEKDLSGLMLNIAQRLGEPVVRAAVGEAMRLMGSQFVLGRSIKEALNNGESMRSKGYQHSFDMLGEAARTETDAQRYFLAYSRAISTIAEYADSGSVHDNPGISVKLSALHPRYEYVQRARVLRELAPRLAALAEQAKAAHIGLSVDAEEMDRLDLALDIMETVLRSPSLAGWDGFGVVVQAYSKQAFAIIDWLQILTQTLDRRINVRLVKGAYWDSEIKNAQILGLERYPVFTRKAATDVSYLACARKLFAAAPRIFPQFATHNAQTVSAILAMAGGANKAFEFQRLHGMGEALHELLRQNTGQRCRIYVPVGIHKDLLAYLVRRLLENGANSSFVHQLLDHDIPAAAVVADPITQVSDTAEVRNPRIPLPPDLFAPDRANAKGWNLNDANDAELLEQSLAAWRGAQWQAVPLVAGCDPVDGQQYRSSPTDRRDQIGTIIEAGPTEIEMALRNAETAFADWSALNVEERAVILERTADLYEQHTAELIALASREAGKTRLDGILEVREAVDFLRYYAHQARHLFNDGSRAALGPVVCISPWNFPLAIFTGQIVAALVAGNSVIAKPAEETPLIAHRAVTLMHEAGIPTQVLSLLPGTGETVGAALTSDARVKAVCFTGSTETAQLIDHALANKGDPSAVLIAETGGLNAMIVDSTALPEQAVRDIIQSAFQSAGQRCSALRLLVIQKDIAEAVLTMLEGAARELVIGDPWDSATDVGPVIDSGAQSMIEAYCDQLDSEDRCLFRFVPPDACAHGTFVAPAAYRLDRIEDLEKEIFGPVLHVTTFAAEELDEVVERINNSGYGLTLGVHSRVDERMDRICTQAQVGNIYLNRNQIGAVVGVQPFGGEGLSGTGPKAGGPLYLYRFSTQTAEPIGMLTEPGKHNIQRLAHLVEQAPAPMQKALQSALVRAAQVNSDLVVLPGPTGERNSYRLYPRGLVLCAGGGEHSSEALAKQCLLAAAAGNSIVLWQDVAPGIADRLALLLQECAQESQQIRVVAGDLAMICRENNFQLAVYDGGESLGKLRSALADLKGARIPLINSDDAPELFYTERVVSEDTTASGGNARLLANV